MRKLKAAAASHHKKDEAWRVLFFFLGKRGMSSVSRLFRPFLSGWRVRSLLCLGPRGPTCGQASLSQSRLPILVMYVMFSGICGHRCRQTCRFCSCSKTIFFLLFFFFNPLARNAVYISRESNKRSALFALPKFPHHFFSVTPQLSCFTTWHFHPIFQAQPGFPSPLPPGQQRLSSSLVSPRSESCP